MSEIDYTKYSLGELIDARSSIDPARHPERTAQLDLLIKDRQARQEAPPEVSIKSDSRGRVLSVKRGRAPSLGKGLGSLGGVAFGILWTSLAYEKTQSIWFAAFGVLIVISSLVTAVYHFYNAFSARRFSDYDLTKPDAEPDVLDSILGYDATDKSNGRSGT